MRRGAGHRADRPDDEDRDEGDDDVDEVFAAAAHGQDAVRDEDGARQARAAHGQGRSDFTMNIVGAAGGAVAGPIVHNWGMPTLASLTGFLIIVAVVILLPRVRDISTR